MPQGQNPTCEGKLASRSPQSEGILGLLVFLLSWGPFSCSSRDPHCVCVSVGCAEALPR